VLASLLTLARADAGSLAVCSEPVDLAELCREILSRMRPFAGARTLIYEGLAEVMVMGDPDWLRQLLLNLVENAIHHTEPGGTVRIAAGGRGENVWLEVSDDG